LVRLVPGGRGVGVVEEVVVAVVEDKTKFVFFHPVPV